MYHQYLLENDVLQQNLIFKHPLNFDAKSSAISLNAESFSPENNRWNIKRGI